MNKDDKKIKCVKKRKFQNFIKIKKNEIEKS